MLIGLLIKVGLFGSIKKLPHLEIKVRKVGSAKWVVMLT
jgi:hypothetical protein